MPCGAGPSLLPLPLKGESDSVSLREFYVKHQ